ncbi:MAG: hypothetical protein JNL39_15680, partial [Opitutaceae bacterium]|nr:hypothetical protein [Opitutaceae bacterium]
MSNSNAGGEPDNEWEDRGDVAWNEFDWERYLREQDNAVERYARLYAARKDPTDRIDKVAEQMHWGDAERDETESDEDEDIDDEVYTLHRNPIYVASRGIHLSVARSWERL